MEFAGNGNFDAPDNHFLSNNLIFMLLCLDRSLAFKFGHSFLSRESGMLTFLSTENKPDQTLYTAGMIGSNERNYKLRSGVYKRKSHAIAWLYNLM